MPNIGYVAKGQDPDKFREVHKCLTLTETSATRTVLQAVLASLRSGDRLIVDGYASLGESLADIDRILAQLSKMGAMVQIGELMMTPKTRPAEEPRARKQGRPTVVPVTDNEILRMTDIEGRSIRQIADHFGISKNAVHNAIQRAREPVTPPAPPPPAGPRGKGRR
jgi:predicted DNA-binding protein (UPF0251 family)